MKKLTRSTFGSCFKSPRKKRTSQLGRPATRSTRTRSRMTRSTNNRALFSATASPGNTGAATVKTNVPVSSGANDSGTV